MIKYAPSTDMKDVGYEIFIAMISILSVINMIILWIPGMNPDNYILINIINAGLTIVFLMDFLYRLFTAKSRRQYFFWNWGWADLLACAPQLRILRLFRIFKAYRIIDALGAKNIIKQLSDNRAETAIYILIFSVIIIIEIGAFLILIAESASDSANILNASDAIWWIYVTITTVGYGDYYPVTQAGKFIGILIMTTGVGIFATFAGYIANKLLASKKEDVIINPDIEADISIKLDLLHKTITEQQIREIEIISRLDRIEQAIKERDAINAGNENHLGN